MDLPARLRPDLSHGECPRRLRPEPDPFGGRRLAGRPPRRPAGVSKDGGRRRGQRLGLHRRVPLRPAGHRRDPLGGGPRPRGPRSGRVRGPGLGRAARRDREEEGRGGASPQRGAVPRPGRGEVLRRDVRPPRRPDLVCERLLPEDGRLLARRPGRGTRDLGGAHAPRIARDRREDQGRDGPDRRRRPVPQGLPPEGWLSRAVAGRRDANAPGPGARGDDPRLLPRPLGDREGEPRPGTISPPVAACAGHRPVHPARWTARRGQ